MKPIKTTQRLMAYTLINLIAFQPVLPAMAAGVKVAASNTALDNAGNGVPVVNIATPNGAGISHNQYHDFNVDKQGLILNNGTAQLNPTQLGGLIQNNPNLTGKAADAIINEVVSPNRSTLAGYLEVGGKQASVMVANPYGITCDGCGFINTPQVTLTTGTPQFDAQGRLQALEVKGGDITLSGKGLDASQSDYLSLISRTAQINAGLNANDTRIVLGANNVSEEGGVTAREDAAGATRVALDTGALGGMYSNRIRLVSSDKGVGVNVGNLSARSGDITLSANGKLSVGDAIAAGDIRAQGESLALQGKQQAGGEIALGATGGIELTDAALRAGQSVALAAEGELNATGSRISAGVDAQGAVTSGYQLSLKGDIVTINNSQLAADKVAVKAANALRQDEQSAIKADNELTLHGKDIALSGAADARHIRLEAQTLTAAGSARLQAKDSAVVRAAGQGDWQGNLTAGEDLTLEGGQIVQRGTLAGKTLNLKLDSLDNQGDIAALQGLSFVGDQLINGGSLAAAQQLTLKANRLDNAGLLSARGELRLELQALLNNQGKILTENHLFMLADGVSNHGVVQAESLALHGADIANQGTITAQQSIDLYGGTIDNQGAINAGQRIDLHGGAALNGGTLSAGGTLAASLDTHLDNSGMLLAGKALDIRAADVINSGTLTAPDLQLQSASLDNPGIIQADNSLTIDAGQRLVQRADGKLLAGEALTLTAADVETDGELQAKQFLLNAQRWLNQGKTSISGDAQATAYSLENTGSLLAQGNWLLSGQDLVNQGILQGERLELRANNIVNSGRAQSLGSSVLQGDSSLNNSGEWLSGDALQLTSADMDNSGSLRALTIRAQSDRVNNSGQISAIDRLDLTIADRLNNQGTLYADRLALSAGEVNQQGTLEGRSLRVDAGELDNQGTIVGVDALTLAIGDRLHNQGELLSQGDSTSTARLIDNRGEWQAQTITLHADRVSNAGKILGIAALTLTAQDALVNHPSGKLLSQGVAALTAADAVNAGDWQASSLTLEAGNLSNSGRIQGAQALTVALDGADGSGRLSNDGALISGGDSLLSARQMDNQGALQGNNITIAVDSLNNAGKISGADSLTLALEQSLDNSGDLHSDRLRIDAAGVNNRGGLFGVSDLQLRLRGDLDNAGTLSGKALDLTAQNIRQNGLLEGQRLDVHAETLDNQGKTLGVDALTLAIGDALHNSGALLSQGDSTVTAQTVDNHGQWQAGNIALTADEVSNAGQIVGIAALTLTANRSLRNLQSGKLLTQGVATLRAADALNQGEWQAGSLLLAADGFANQGTIISAGDTQLSARQINNQGVLSGRGATLLVGEDIRNDGDLLAADSLSVAGNYQGAGRLQTDGTLTLRGDSLRNGGDWQGDTLRLQGLTLENQGTLLGNTIDVSANKMVNGGDIYGNLLAINAAQAANDGTLTGVEGLSVNLAGDLVNQGDIASRLLSVEADNLTNRGNMQGVNDLRLALQNDLHNDGLISGSQALELTAKNIDQRGTLEGRTLTMRAANLDNQGRMLGVDALTVTLDAADGGRLLNQGMLLSGGDTRLSASQIDNQGIISGNGATVLISGETRNDGDILAAQSLSLYGDYQGQGSLHTDGALTLRGGYLRNAGYWESRALALAGDTIANQGTIVGTVADIIAKDVINDGEITAVNKLTFTLENSLSNQGALNGTLLEVSANRLSNKGEINAVDGLTLAVNDGLDNQGALYGASLTIAARDLVNRGAITGIDSLKLNLAQSLNNIGSLNSNLLTAEAAQGTNDGQIIGVNGLSLSFSGDLDNNGLISGNNTLNVAAGRVNQRDTLEGRTLHIQADELDNQGKMLGVDALTLAISGNARNQGKWLSQGDSTLTAERVENLGVWLADTIDAAAALLTNNGNIIASAGLSLNGEYQGDGLLYTTGLLALRGNRLTNTGRWESRALQLTAGSLDNQGTIIGEQSLELDLSGDLTVGADGQLLTNGELLAQAANVSNQGFWQGKLLALTADALLNHGTLVGLNHLQITSRETLTNREGGEILTNGDAVINSARFSNGGALLADDLLLSAERVENQGEIFSQGTAVLSGAAFDNGGTVTGIGGLDLQFTDSLLNLSSGRLLSGGALSVQAEDIDNQGAINAADLTLRGANGLNNNGVLQGSTSLKLESAGQLSNQQAGQILSDGTATLQAAALDNAGWLQGRNLDVQAQRFSQQGSLIAQDKLTLRIPQWVNRGLIQAQRAEIIADVLENQGTLLGLTQLALQTQRLINQVGGKIYSAQDLSLKTAELQQDGQLLALGNLTADISGPLAFTQILAAGKKLTLNVAGDLDQRGTLQGQSVALTSTGSLTNQGAILAGDGDSTISAKNIIQQEAGSIQAVGNLSLASEKNIDNQGLIGAAGDLLMQAGSALNNTSLLYAGGNMRLFSDSLSNIFGNILAGNNLWIQRDAQGNASASVLNSSGTIETQSGDINIVTGTLTNQREGLVVTETALAAESVPDWVGATTANIPIDHFDTGSYGVISDVVCRGGGGENGRGETCYTTYKVYGPKEHQVMLASKDIKIVTQGDTASIISGRSIAILAQILNNDASNVLAQDNILLVGDRFKNQTYQEGKINEYLTYEYVTDSQRASRLNENINYLTYKLSGTPTYEQTVGESYNALIQAGGTITADFKEDISNTTLQPGSGGFIPGTVTPVLAATSALSPLQQQTALAGNDASLVDLSNALEAADNAVGETAKNVSLSQVTSGTTTLENAERQALTKNDALVLQQPGQTNPAATEIALSNNGQISPQQPGLSIDRPATNIEQPQAVALNPLDAAVGTVAAPEKPQLAADAAETPISVESSAPFSQLSAAELLSSIGNGLQALSSNPLADYPLPTGNNGLLVVDPASDSRYLIHSNPQLEQLGQVDNALFSDLQNMLGQRPSTAAQIETSAQWTQADQVLGSAYLLDKLNLDADHDYRFLGDAAFDTRYISNAVLSQSGKRYLEGTGSDLSQMQMLLDNAAAAQKGLDLQLGVSLTADQVANLSQSIVWWENIEVNGQTVLAPKLYLAQADQNNLQGSAIVANQVQLSAGGSVTNSGTINAVELLAIASGDNIDNQEGGLLKADGSLNLIALNNITNSGSRIEGGTLQLASINGDVINKTESRQWQSASDGLSHGGTGSITYSELGVTAAIVAGDSLTISAGNNVRNLAATLSAGQDMTLNAGNNIAIEALTLTNNRLDQGRINQSSLNTAVQGGSVNAGGALQANAGNDIRIDAGDLSGETGLSLAAGNDIQLTAQQTLEETLSSNGGGTAQRRTQEIAATQLLSGGDLSLSAGRDILSEAASLTATGNAALTAGRDLDLLAETEESYSGNWWKRHADWQQSITQQSSEITAGEGLTLQAGNDINLQAAQGIADGALTAQAGNDINLLSAAETQHTFFEETKIKKKTFSKTVTHTIRDNFSTEEKGSLLLGGSVVLQADHDINVKGSAIAGNELVALKAGNDIDATASIEERRDYEKQTRKKSGLMSGGGLGFTIGKQSSTAEYNGVETRQSEARSLIGAEDGNVVIQAGKNVSVTGSDVIAARTTQSDDSERGNIAILAENIAIASGQDTLDITTRFESKSSGISIALKGTPYDSYQNMRDIAQTEGATSRVRLLIGETAAMIFDAPQIAVSVGSSSSKSSQHTQGVYQIGSALTAAGNIQLQATGDGQLDQHGKARSGDILVAGSAVDGGEDVLLNATRGIALQSVSNTEHTTQHNSSSGWSFSDAIAGIGTSIRHIGGGPNHGAGMIPLASEQTRETQQADTLAQTVSTVSGRTVTLNSQDGDILVAGSAVNGVNDVLLQAGNGNVVVNAGQNNARNETTGSSKTIGDLGGDGYSGTVGWQSTKYHALDEVNQQSAVRSHLQSNEGNVSVVAKEDVTIAGTDLRAGGSLSLTGRNITLDPAVDTELRLREQQSSQYGVTTALSGYVVSAVQAVEKLSQSVEDKRDPRLSAIYAAQSALTLATQTTVTDMNSAAVKVTVSVGGGSSRSSQRKEAVTQEGSTLYAGEEIRLAAERDITAVGADIRARNIELNAGDSLNLVAAQNEESITGSSGGSRAGVGVGFGLGGQQNGFTVELSASAQQGKESGNNLTHQLTQVYATEQVKLVSGADTLLNGAVVSGQRVAADVGGDLLISSTQDKATYDSKNSSAGLNVSICVPPICAGQTVAGNANLSQQILNNNYASVREQSGIRAGDGGFDIRVGNHTQLDGAVLASEADADKNRLSTATLGWRDIANISDYQGSGFSIGVSTDSMPVSSLAQNKDRQSGITQSAVAPAVIEIRDGSAQRQDIAQLSRDTAGANDSVNDGFDRQKVEDKLAIQKEATALGAQALDAYKTYKKSEAVEQARTRLTQEGVSADEIEARIQSSEEVQTVEREYGAGSEFWTAGTALTAVLAGGLGGNATGVVTGAAAPYLAGLVKEVGQDNESARIALHTVLGAFLAQAQGGSAAGGAAGGLVSSAGAQALTTLLYPGVKAEELTGEQKELIANLITLAGAGAGGLVGGNLTGAGSGANTAKNEVENNYYFNLGKGLQDYSQSVMSLYTNTNLTDKDGNVLNPITEEERQYAMHKLVTGTMPEGQDISKAIVDGYTNGVLIAGAWYLGPAASIGKVAVGSAVGGGANAAYQWYDLSQPGNENKTHDYWSSTSALVTGGLAPGRNIWQNVGIAAGGAVFTDGPNVGAMGGAATGAWFGAKFGQYAPDIINSVTGKDLPGFVYDVGGAFVSETVSDVSKDALKIKESKK
ncbi:hemagglutinin repeat-containing protein [Brenneria tiliae]|uniref:hemagglutinin repeat-containing protein n=1 Tax=Brenneria tiliae TaxID=2914984 RepID=UPI002014DDB3|nr:hemagglutinin repeat-containing protein [Brenneria tiliae]MCL2896794.1 hemagglutinin repeat-containing protein [Brenneria tiliae]MCL2901223.1 hemagglutinin repeat-containing protein [Brenneria tiliae]